jgi:hypothetical protein
VTVNGQAELVDLVIAPAAIDTGDPEETAQTLADLILAAYRDACSSADELQQETMAPFAAGLGAGSLPGMPDISGFPGLPGVPGAPAAGQEAADETDDDSPNRES